LTHLSIAATSNRLSAWQTMPPFQGAAVSEEMKKIQPRVIFFFLAALGVSTIVLAAGGPPVDAPVFPPSLTSYSDGRGLNNSGMDPCRVDPLHVRLPPVVADGRSPHRCLDRLRSNT
jgi:hypothetical protein